MMIRGLFLALALTALGSFGVLSSIPNPPVYTADSVVKVILERSSGSGVYIGEGLILTAAHVVKDAGTVTIKATDGTEMEGEVLWSAKSRDIALIKITRHSFIRPAELACVSPKRGDPITAEGNPLYLEWITVWGHVGGAARQLGPWHSVFVTDIATLWGQSGGPVYNTRGEVIGITVGVMTARSGDFEAPLGLGYVVPASVVCQLLGR